MQKLILASASPRRSQLLRNFGIEFEVVPANLPEEQLPGEDAHAFAQRLAKEKAKAVGQQHPQNFVLGADTIVLINGEVLGKPRDAEDARRMLRMLSGKTHEVATAVCLAGPGGEETAIERTQVTMSEIPESEIADYIASGEPMDKAGAYAIQGGAKKWISRVEGDYFNVVGLPVPLVVEMLQRRGLR